MTAHRLDILDLCHTYPGHIALAGLSCELETGITGLLGLNGAGKTTCLRLLAGLLPVQRGRILLNGEPVAEDGGGWRAQVGHLPDDPPLAPELTVDEHLHFAARLFRVADPRAAVADARRRCGLDRMGGRLAGELSKGYRQRLGLAQAIIHDPRLLLLDEPSDGLDPAQMSEFRALLHELGSERIVLLSSHRLAEVRQVCGRVLVLHEGELVHDSADRSHTAPAYRVRFRQPPETEALLALPAVAGAEARADGLFLIRPSAELPLAEALSGQGWGLETCEPSEDRLEELFTRLARGEAA